jgi:hypothetical protein
LRNPQPSEAHISRPATRPRNRRRPAQRIARGRAAAADRTQERLWADCIAAQPEIISDIVTFIAAARTRIIESPPLAPSDDPAADDAEMTDKPRK